MWTSVVVAVAALAAPAADGDSLTLANVRATHGVLGPGRSDNRVLPGDRYVLSFDIEGITLGPDGKVAYSIGTEVRNAAGRLQHQQEPKAVEAPTSLGGGRVPAHARLDVGLDTPPGVYTLKVTVTDRVAAVSKSLAREVEVLPKRFGIVRVSITNDPEGQLPAAAFGAGQAAWLQLGAVGFASPDAGKPPAVTFTLRILDQNSKPTQAKPLEAASSKDVPPGAALAPVQFLLALNRPGKFMVEITATDDVSRKTTTLTLPLTVTESN
jgi:hypothetical protein